MNIIKNAINYVRCKLSVKVSLWVVLFAAIIFNIALAFFFYQAREAVRLEAINRATQILDNTTLRVEAILNRVEVASTMTKWLAERHPYEPDSMFVYSKSILRKNPDLYNCSIAFEPYHFMDRGRYFSAYTKHVGDSLRTIQGGSDDYQYFYMDWYLMPLLLDKPCWTEPYVDYDVATNTSEMLTSYCQSIMDQNGQEIGVVNTSLSLNWLSQTISAVKPYPHSYSIMIGRGGTYFVHPDSTKITRQTIFTQTMEHPDTAMTALGHAMQRGEKGIKHMTIDGNECYVFYKPIGQTGCSMAIICPESDIFGGFDHLRHIVWAILLIGLVLMLFFFIRIITRELKPLGTLAEEAETIAAGQFDVQLPDFKRIDEIGQLSRSFSGMQQSLVQYIKELKETTTEKASIETDLRIASDIQMGMVPHQFPTKTDSEDVQIFASLTPAKDVGGDLFDFYFRDEKLFFCIGDVSGKGVPASLFMAVTRAVFRTVSARESMPDRIVTEVNKTMCDMNTKQMFVTLFVGVLDLPTGRLYYCNAGHDEPLLVGDGVGELRCNENIPVGVLSTWKFTLQEARIYTGTTIFLFTDGLTEAMDANHNLFGIERIVEEANHILGQGHQEPRQIIDQMTDAVHQFVGDAEQSDDLTMMAIQYIRKQSDIRMRSHLVLDNNMQEVPRLNDFVQEVCETIGFNEPNTSDIKKAITEAVVNVIKYAYPRDTHGEVNIEAASNDMRLKFTIMDSGKPFDPTVRVDASDEENHQSTRGIRFVRQVMDSINYERVDGMNVLTLRKKLTDIS